MSSSSKRPIPIHHNKRKRDAIPLSNNGDVLLAMAPRLSPIDPNGSNVVFSPLSLRAVVSLVAAGASNPAAEQLLSFFKSESIDDVNTLSSKLVSAVLADARGPKICFANGVWIHKDLSLKHSFKQVVGNVYKADLSQVDFITKAEEIVSEVNSWAAEKTDDQIGEILLPGSLATTDRLILANALYFKGAWDCEYFLASETKEYDFRLLNGESVKVPFMTTNFSKLSIGTYDGFKVLRLRYKRGDEDDCETRFSMYILLPDASDGLASLAERVASEPDFLDGHLDVGSVYIKKVLIPKFKISFGFTASETLKQLGVTLPFKAGGLTEMVDSPEEEGENLFVSGIYQKSFIEVDEEGTTAKSVTRGLLCTCPRIRNYVDFVADHPFMFLIREDVSGAVLFFGHVLNPLKE